jgi:hypothetical protein
MQPDRSRLRSWRLASQRMTVHDRQSPEQLVELLVGVQGQDYRWAKWSIGLRIDGCTDDQVERTIQESRIIRTWSMRGTLHFVAAADLTGLTSLLAPRIIRGNARRYRQLELDEAVFSKSQVLLRQAIQRDGPLTRAQIKARFEEEGIPAEGQQVPYILQRASLDGLICHGPLKENDPTYALISDWVKVRPTPNEEFNLVSLAERYFASHGPAARRDFAWWAGQTLTRSRAIIDSSSALKPLEGGEGDYWTTGDPPANSGEKTAHLLPPFDEYILGYKERSLALDPAFAKRVNPGGGMLKPTVLVNGEVIGLWGYKVNKGQMSVSIDPFRDLEEDEKDHIESAASRFADFMSMPTELKITFSDID